jgi:hypothetical protein
MIVSNYNKLTEENFILKEKKVQRKLIELLQQNFYNRTFITDI